MQVPDWFKKINTFIYISLFALIMIIFSMMYDKEKYIHLWLLSYLYGILMYILTITFIPKNSLIRKWILMISFLVYMGFFVFFWLFFNQNI